MSHTEGLKGMRDFYPAEMRLRRWIEDRWREVAREYAFEEYDAPLMEPLELYTRKSGEDIVGQLYAFEDKAGREIALRPEMTPSLARMVAARSQGLPKPIKWFSIPRCFRYERPQRGRFREFWQLNLDILGISEMTADAEIMAAGIDSLRSCGLKVEDFEVRYSDRRLLEVLLEGLGVAPGERQAVYVALDKMSAAGQEETAERLEKCGLTQSASRALVGAIAQHELGALREFAENTGTDLSHPVDGITELKHHLESYGVGEFCRFDAAVVRGLAYYTGVVFEMYDRQGELRALCGGGRYDDLLKSVGGQELPAVGFGLGEAVLTELMEGHDRLPVIATASDAYVIPVTEADREEAIRVATALRHAGLCVDIPMKDQSLGKALKRVGQSGARVAVVVGESEREAGSYTVRNMSTGEERALSLEAIIEELSGGREVGS